MIKWINRRDLSIGRGLFSLFDLHSTTKRTRNFSNNRRFFSKNKETTSRWSNSSLFRRAKQSWLNLIYVDVSNQISSSKIDDRFPLVVEAFERSMKSSWISSLTNRWSLDDEKENPRRRRQIHLTSKQDWNSTFYQWEKNFSLSPSCFYWCSTEI